MQAARVAFAGKLVLLSPAPEAGVALEPDPSEAAEALVAMPKVFAVSDDHGLRDSRHGGLVTRLVSGAKDLKI